MKTKFQLEHFLKVSFDLLQFLLRPSNDIATIVVLHAMKHLDDRRLQALAQDMEFECRLREAKKSNECSH